MLKVIIADDEERICKLVHALVDWESLSMEVVATAHNGLETLELVRKYPVDILITDIRMPGMSGLDVIRELREERPGMEIIIISGYAHFEYAKTAISYGVGNYLLKPINKTELVSTLEKVRDGILNKRAIEENTSQLIQKNEKDIKRIQRLLIDYLLEQKCKKMDLEELNEEYHLHMHPGCFQAFWLKMDGKTKDITPNGMGIVMGKVEQLLEKSLEPKCIEMIITQKSTSCIGIMNYKTSEQGEIKRILRNCLTQLEYEKALYGDVTFSMAISSLTDKTEDLVEIVNEVVTTIKERLTRGTGKILERIVFEKKIRDRNMLETYLRMITQAIELKSPEESEKTIQVMLGEIEKAGDMYGYEILDLVHTCGNLFLSQIKIENRQECLAQFDEECDQCRDVEELFGMLEELQNSHIQRIRQQYTDDVNRPIRQAKQYIQNHYQEPISLETVSEIVGLSPAYFSTLFKKYENEGFAKYLINVRVEQAKIILRESNISISEVCKKVGYNDIKHFNQTFEKVTGVKPTTYRKLYG